VVVLEDMPPSWGDIANGAIRASRVAPGGGDPSKENPAHPSGRGWPLQSDHLRIRESDMRSWMAQRFKVARREWIGRYLTFVLRKIEPLEDAQAERVAVETQQEQDCLYVLLEERGQFVQRLQAYEKQLGEAKSALVKERRRIRRLRKRIKSLNQQTHNVYGSRMRRLLEKLGRNRLEDRRNGE
jgi:hypothetical protein